MREKTKGGGVTLTQTLFEIIDMRSFSNLWYWIGLAVVWSLLSQRVLGAPHDLIQSARHLGGEAEEDLEHLVRIYCNRAVQTARVSGIWQLGFASFILTALAVTGFFYRVEVAQALFLLAFPLATINVLNLSGARKFQQTRIAQTDRKEALYTLLSRHRFYTQCIGMASIFITSLWGMFWNIRDFILLQ